LVSEVGSIMRALEDADPADKAGIYQRLGLTLTYHPQDKRVAAEARPNSIMYVRGSPRGDMHLTYMINIVLTTQFALAGRAEVLLG
jgi:site-specific DNA recombinase